MILNRTNSERGLVAELIKRILVVDDEPEIIKTIKRHLKREGFFLDSAGDGKDASHKVQDGFLNGFPFDLVITDVLMPNMDGIKFMQWIKKAHPRTSVLLTSGFNDNEIAMETIRPEMDGFAQKPFTPKEMMQLIGSIDYKRRYCLQHNKKEKFKH